MAFSGGSYEEVARWLRSFVVSHAKRVDPRIEVELDAGETREGKSYLVRLRLGAMLAPPLELAYHEVAESRGAVAWCRAEADRVKVLARELTAGTLLDAAGAR
jgi:hypothetical protein